MQEYAGMKKKIHFSTLGDLISFPLKLICLLTAAKEATNLFQLFIGSLHFPFYTLFGKFIPMFYKRLSFEGRGERSSLTAPRSVLLLNPETAFYLLHSAQSGISEKSHKYKSKLSYKCRCIYQPPPPFVPVFINVTATCLVQSPIAPCHREGWSQGNFPEGVGAISYLLITKVQWCFYSIFKQVMLKNTPNSMIE